MRTYLIEEPVILDPWVMKAQLLLFFVMWFSCGMYTNTNIDPYAIEKQVQIHL